MTKLTKNIFPYIILMLIGCSPTPHDVVHSDAQPQIYPDYIGVEVPTNIAPLNFCMADRQTEWIDVTIKGSMGGAIHSDGQHTTFDINEWHELLEQNRDSKLIVTVLALKNDKWTQYSTFDIYVAPNEIKEKAITYRLVAPGYEIYGKMGIYQRELSTFEETPIIENTAVPSTCINCHVTNEGDPSYSVMHARGAHGATLIHDNGKAESLVAKNAELGCSMVYPYWHPTGRYCAFSTNDTQQMFHSTAEKIIEVFDTKSDIILYNPLSHTITPLLNDTTVAENTPVFSHDGKRLYYITAPIVNMPEEYTEIKYSLCAVDFNAETGQITSKPDTLIDARETGKSVTWPRPSADGRYIMYTTIDYGYFSIWHPEADLYLLDLKTGEKKSLAKANSERAESYHVWSADSQWFLFTSRRDDDLYSRIYLARIDDEGNVSKPFLLPQENPYDDNIMRLFSYNTPDFIDHYIETSANEIADKLNDTKRIKTIYNISTMKDNPSHKQ